eukprot:m.60143 g.60143  ORF g.60143 m.60143 type:complete len:403 (+) comp34920_c0_seq2:1202-2410(+)
MQANCHREWHGIQGDPATHFNSHQVRISLEQRRCLLVTMATICLDLERSFFLSIVDEAGASIYSVSQIAIKEMPDLEPNLRSAVSIARRLQDPLAELVKCDPKHVGVGMYQHDMPKKLMDGALDGVVEDAVSFVGVDLNACSLPLLRHVAGLGEARAKAIIEYREKNGSFLNRRQLMKVKGIGAKTFEQCAGFVRINHSSGAMESAGNDVAVHRVGSRKKARNRDGETSASKRKKADEKDHPEPFDATNIHPESYGAAKKLLELLHVSPDMLGKEELCGMLEREVIQRKLVVAEELQIGIPTLDLIVDAFRRPARDLRDDFNQPIFHSSFLSVADLRVGAVLTGRVSNVVTFGVFVDIGVGISGLIHVSNMRKGTELAYGDQVTVRVNSVDIRRNRLSLQPI